MPIDSLAAFRTGGLFLVFEGGQFIWPGVRLGFRRRVTLATPRGGSREVEVETLALLPLVLEVADFLTHGECDHVIEEAGPNMAQSKVALMDKDVGKADVEFRTSSTYFLPSQTDTLREVDDRVASLTRVPRQHQEYVQVLRYGRSHHYGSHHDFWDPIFYQSDEWLAMSHGGFQNRLATVFWYMSDVPLGKKDGRAQPTSKRATLLTRHLRSNPQAVKRISRAPTGALTCRTRRRTAAAAA